PDLWREARRRRRRLLPGDPGLPGDEGVDRRRQARAMADRQRGAGQVTSPAMAPNSIFILADDLGYADLGCYGGRAPTSPNIDRMAAQGMRFTRGYANSAVCSPTRFALATGRYQYRLRGAAEEPIGSAMRGDKVIGLPPEHPTLASRLKEAGYR